MSVLTDVPLQGGADRLLQRDAPSCAFLGPRAEIHLASPAFAGHLGVTPHELAGQDLITYFDPESQHALRARFGSLPAYGGCFEEHAVVVLPDHGRERMRVCVYGFRGAFLATLVPAPEPKRAAIVLTELDARILEAIASGESTMFIGTRLFLSRQGVNYHIGNMLRMFKVANRAALISRAYSAGVLDPASWPPRVAAPHVR